MIPCAAAALSLLLGCEPPPKSIGDGSPGSDGGSTGPVLGESGGHATDDGNTGQVPDPPTGSSTDDGSTGEGSTAEPLVDVLVIVDNSAHMAPAQLRLAGSLPRLIERFEGLTDVDGVPLQPDVNVMVTTTDFGNPLCTAYEPPGYTPAAGAPIGTACTSRLQDFTDLEGTVSMPEACETHCPQPVEPTDAFLHFGSLGDNVPDAVTPADVDGDGDLDSPAAQALACMAPQGIDGCGYESPLESMLQALDPASAWNQGPAPFLREGATLAIVMITDEADCSVEDEAMMVDWALMNDEPHLGVPSPSSAMCWNAGMTCTGPDAMGVFSSCEPQDGGLHEIARYSDYLVQELRQTQGKEVVMLGIVGVPPVVAHDPDAPYQPTAGGVLDLVYRGWIDLPFPAGDIVPDEWAAGITAADKQFELGIGPGCTGTDAMGNITGQAVPPGRILEVCQALDYVDGGTGEARPRCCMESICDADHDLAIDCLMGLVQDAVASEGEG